jgi:outer membrane receptor protein involved in Fe transport
LKYITLKRPNYVFDFSGSYKFKKYFQVEFGVNNFTNASYFARRATVYPGSGILPSDGVSGDVTNETNTTFLLTEIGKNRVMLILRGFNYIYSQKK